MFSIVSPVINKLTGREFKISNIVDMDKYLETSIKNNNNQNRLKSQSENQIQEIYTYNLKSDIKEKINNKGYVVENIKLELDKNEQYKLKSIDLKLNENYKENNTKNEKIKIDTIKIQIDEEQKNSKINKINEKQKKELKEYLSNIYEVRTNNIYIN